MKLCQNQEGIIEKNGFFLKKRPTTLKYHNTPARVGEIENTDSPRAGKDVEQQKLSFVRGDGAQWRSHFGRQFGGFSAKPPLTVRSNNYIFGIYSKGKNLCFQQKPSHCYILYGSNHRTSCKRQNYADSKRISGCQALGGGRDE